MIRKTVFTIAGLVFYCVSTGQVDSIKGGIHFEHHQTWKQVLEKAKSENKYIFLDCYTTWCIPCKLMDKEVYSDMAVGNFINERFISVKVQFDTSENDNDEIRLWYKDVHNIQSKFQVNSFPTFLYLSPQGIPVHRFTGAVRDTDFIKVSSYALKPEKQFYTLLEKYKNGEIDYNNLPKLLRTVKEIGDSALAKSMATDYIQLYLTQKIKSDFLSKNDISFIAENIQWLTSTDKIFNFILDNEDSVNRLVGTKSFVENFASFIIARELIRPVILSKREIVKADPDWNKLYNSLSKKYKEKYVQRAILNEKLKWYTQKQDWQKIVAINITKIERYGLDTAGLGKYLLNNMIFDVIFQHSSDKVALNKGLQWMKIILENNPNDPNHIDTYANLLYKLGNKDAAIKWEEKAIKVEHTLAFSEKREADKTFSETLQKMKISEPTWVISK